MCGIFGACFWPNATSAEVETALNTITERGPDASGISTFAEGRVIFGHRRLSILDLSPCGAQPMTSQSGRYSITFNGEIYNYLSLKNELVKFGFTFNGGSDTEIMLAAFEQWGIKTALKRLEGMFAFGLWDESEKTLTLGRDRIGEKPLYYGWNEGSGFVFASQLSPIRLLLGSRAAVERDSVKLLLTWGYVPAPHSIFKNVFKLPPGTFCSFTLEQLRKKNSNYSPWPSDSDNVHGPQFYWSAKDVFSRATPPRKYDDAVSELDDLLTEVIRDEMMGDVPVGAFLSGGIDSSTVVALMQKVSSRPVKTFSIGFNEQAFNEAHYAKLVAEHLKTDHTELYVSDLMARDVIPALPKMFDEPFGDSSQIPTYLVSKLARQQVTVSLSGDGGDELFAGYPRILWADAAWSKMAILPGGLRKILGKRLGNISDATSELLLRPLGYILPQRFQISAVGRKLRRLGELLHVNSGESLYRSLLMLWNEDDPVVHSARKQLTFIDVCGSTKDAGSYLQWMMLADIVQYLVDDILVKVDRAAMAVSLESRAPFLHHRVVEFAAGLPLDFKLNTTCSKRILRDVLHRYVPRNLIDRPKMGFAIPLGSWLRGELKEWAGGLLNLQTLDSQGLFNTALVTERWNVHQSGKRDLSPQLWSILMFQSWLTENKINI